MDARSDQLMRFAWLILMPVTLVNIVLLGGIWLITAALGLPIWLFLLIVGAINWAMLTGFIFTVTRVTRLTTKRATAPALRGSHARKSQQEEQQKLLVPRV